MLFSSFILLSLGSGGLEPLIVLCFGDALFNEPFTIASPFVILILAGSHWHFVTRRAMNRIPAFGFGRCFQDCLVRVRVRFTRQFPFGLFPIGFGHLERGTAVD